MKYSDVMTLLKHEACVLDISKRIAAVMEGESEVQHLFIKALLDSELTQDLILDIAGHHVEDASAHRREYSLGDWADFKREEMQNE